MIYPFFIISIIMAVTIPQSIREQLGEQASQDLAHLLDQTMAGEKLERLSFDMEIVKREITGLKESQEKLNQRFDVMETRFEERFTMIENRLGMIEERFGVIENRLSGIEERFDQINERLLSSIRWTVGTIALFGTLISILMAIAEFSG